MTALVAGKKIASGILTGLKSKIQNLGFTPKLVVILVGQNPASLSYIKTKQKMAENIGIAIELKKYSEDISQTNLETEIRSLNSAPRVNGIIVQLPLPKHLDRDKVLNAVAPRLDIDCLTAVNIQRLADSKPLYMPPAAAAVMTIFEDYKIELTDKNILIIGSGDLIGKPLGAILRNKNIPFAIANRETKNLAEMANQADIIITGVGHPGLLTGDMIKAGAVVIDAGTTGSTPPFPPLSKGGMKGGIVGDVDMQSVMGHASLLAPVPGGVGPVTVALLLANLVQSAQ